MRFYGWLLILLWSCGGGSQHTEGENTVRFRQYMVQGEQLYQQYCSNCHQNDGQGLARLYPPLAKADYMLENLERTVCLMKYGMEGRIVVNGKDYNLKMPANLQLTDLEIAEIATYIHNSWGNQHGLISVTEVAQLLDQCVENENKR